METSFRVTVKRKFNDIFIHTFKIGFQSRPEELIYTIPFLKKRCKCKRCFFVCSNVRQLPNFSETLSTYFIKVKPCAEVECYFIIICLVFVFENGIQTLKNNLESES